LGFSPSLTDAGGSAALVTLKFFKCLEWRNGWFFSHIGHVPKFFERNKR